MNGSWGLNGENTVQNVKRKNENRNEKGDAQQFKRQIENMKLDTARWLNACNPKLFD